MRGGVRLESNGEYWRAAWVDSRGRVVRESIGAKKKILKREAKAKCLELAIAHNLTPGRREKQKIPTLGEFVKRYMADRSPEFSEATIRLHDSACRRLCERFGEKRELQDITRSDAAEFRSWLGTLRVNRVDPADGKAKPVPLQEASIRGIIGRVKVILGYAVDLDFIPTDPFSRIPSGQPRTTKRMRYVSVEETERMLDRCPDQAHRTLLALCRFGGLRRGEALRLAWPSVDFAERALSVVPASHKETTKQRFRRVPVAPQLMAELQRAYDQAGEGTVLVCLMPIEGLEERIRAIGASAGVGNYGKPLHTLRASCESDWLQAWPVMDVCAALGHDPAVAAKHYHITKTEVFKGMAATDFPKSGPKATQSVS